MDNAASSYRRFLEGDEAAFDEIVKELFDNLVFFLDRYVHDLQVAEDLAIDAFSELLVHRHRYNFRVTLKTYLFMIGRSRALNHIKRRNQIPMLPLSSAETLSAEQESLEQKLLADERKKAVQAALTHLPEDMQIAVHLVYFEELSYEEAGKLLRKSRKQVDNLLYRAKKTLRTIFEKEGEQLL